jgi:hypothetical protein
MIQDVYPGSRISDPGVKKHRIPDPQHGLLRVTEMKGLRKQVLTRLPAIVDLPRYSQDPR